MKHVIYLGYRMRAPNLPVGPFDHLDTDPYCADFCIGPFHFALKPAKSAGLGAVDGTPTRKLLAWRARPLAIGVTTAYDGDLGEV